MPAYFASDVHLRLDRPDRGHRFSRFVDALRPEDPLTIVGDLCDFWFAARQRRADPLACSGLRALANYRDRGGDLTILLGNHDAWLGPFYAATLGARLAPEPLDLVVSGLRLHLVHGHLLGARSAWKAAMESRAFLSAFSATPAPVARTLGHLLNRTNGDHRGEDERRHLRRFRAYADRPSTAETPDLVILGHVHTPSDDPGPPRMIVLGSWHDGGSYLTIDDGAATLRTLTQS